MEKICSHCSKPFIAVREAKKYCSDSCKQLAFYKRNSDIADIESEEQEYIDRADDCEKIEDINEVENIENGTAIINDLKKTITKTERKYEPVISNFIEELFNKTEGTEIYIKFQQPQKYWATSEFENIKWVSKRFRCLLENILRLSNQSTIPRDVFNTLKKAFTNIVEAPKFEQLPNDYPYTTLIISLLEQCENVVNTLPKKESTDLMIKRNRKIELLAARFTLSTIVPKVKFTDLWVRGETKKDDKK